MLTFNSLCGIISGIFNGIIRISDFLGFVFSNIWWVVGGCVVGLIILLIIYLIAHTLPHWGLILLIFFTCIGCSLGISAIIQHNNDINKLPSNAEISSNLNIAVKENWTNTNGGFTLDQINKAQQDSDAPTLDDDIITLTVQDYGSYVCFYFIDNSGLYQNAVFLKTEKGLIYDGILMTTCHMYDEKGGWWAFTRQYVYESLNWNFDKSQTPYYYEYNLANASSRDARYCTSNFDGWAFNHKNTAEAKRYVIEQLTTAGGILATNINQFTKFTNIELIGTKENATKSINTFYNYLWEQIQGTGSSGSKNINVTNLTCYPIPAELQSNYPIPDSKKAEYDNANYYGVYKVNTFVNLTLEQGNKTISKNKNADKYVEDNKDSGRLDVDKITTNSADYTKVSITLNCVDGDISTVNLEENPVTITFYNKQYDITKSITYSLKEKLNSVVNVLLISNSNWELSIKSNELVFDAFNGYIEPVGLNANISLDYRCSSVSKISLKTFPGTNLRNFDITKSPVTITLVNKDIQKSYVVIFDTQEKLENGILASLKLGNYTFTIVSNGLDFPIKTGDITIENGALDCVFFYTYDYDYDTSKTDINIKACEYEQIIGSGISSTFLTIKSNLNTNSIRDYFKSITSNSNGTLYVKATIINKDTEKMLVSENDLPINITQTDYNLWSVNISNSAVAQGDYYIQITLVWEENGDTIQSISSNFCEISTNYDTKNKAINFSVELEDFINN